jgi:multiple sugar transport system permease protein
MRTARDRAAPVAAAVTGAEAGAIARRERTRARAEAFTEGRSPMQVIGRAVLYATLISLAVVFVIPFAWLVSNSLKDVSHVFDQHWIPQPTIEWQNYPLVMTLEALGQSSTLGLGPLSLTLSPVLTMIKNSVIVSTLGVLFVVISSSAIAFALARLRFPGSNVVFLLVLATMLLPAAVTMVPVYLIWFNVRQFTDALTGGFLVIGTNTLWPLFLGNLFGSSFYIFMIRQFFLGIPQELIDAARVDGASYYRIYWQVMLPLVRPALLSVAILEFQAKWNDFLTPLIYIQKPELYTLPLGLARLVQHQGFGQFHWELLFAATVIFALPTILLFFFAQKQFIQGITAGSVKG